MTHTCTEFVQFPKESHIIFSQIRQRILIFSLWQCKPKNLLNWPNKGIKFPFHSRPKAKVEARAATRVKYLEKISYLNLINDVFLN